MIDSRTTTTLSKAICAFEAGRKVLPQPVQLLLDAGEDLDRVGRRQQLDADARRLDAAEPQPRRVALGAELDAADVLARARARRRWPALTTTSSNCGDLGQPARRAHAQLDTSDRPAPASRRCCRPPPARSARAARRRRRRPSARGRRACSGSSHSRIANLRSPKMMTLPTPGTRLNASRTYRSR